VSDPLAEIYDEHILDHFESPYHKGTLACASCQHAERNPICGDQLTLQLQIGDGKVQQAYFDGNGCAISQAAASILCEHIEGRSVEDLRQFSAKEMLQLLQVPLTPSRQKCGLLGFKVLKTMLYQLAEEPVATSNPVVS
jgi:nitrogen fixation NifU-like protein